MPNRRFRTTRRSSVRRFPLLVLPARDSARINAYGSVDYTARELFPAIYAENSTPIPFRAYGQPVARYLLTEPSTMYLHRTVRGELYFSMRPEAASMDRYDTTRMMGYCKECAKEDCNSGWTNYANLLHISTERDLAEEISGQSFQRIMTETCQIHSLKCDVCELGNEAGKIHNIRAIPDTNAMASGAAQATPQEARYSHGSIQYNVHAACVPSCSVCDKNLDVVQEFSRGLMVCIDCIYKCPVCRVNSVSDEGDRSCTACAEKTYATLKAKHNYSGNVPSILGCPDAAETRGIYYGAELEMTGNEPSVRSMLWRMQMPTAWRGSWGRISTAKEDGSLPDDGYEMVTIPLRGDEMRGAFVLMFTDKLFRGRIPVSDEGRAARMGRLVNKLNEINASPAKAEEMPLPKGLHFTAQGGNHFHVSGLKNEDKARLWYLLALPTMKFIHYLGFGRRADNYASLESMLVKDYTERRNMGTALSNFYGELSGQELDSDERVELLDGGFDPYILQERYRAMTFYSRYNTIEFRLFKTPETLGEALKNFDYLEAMIAYAKWGLAFNQITRESFLDFLKENAALYPHLMHFLVTPTRWARHAALMRSSQYGNGSRENHPAFSADHTSSFGVRGQTWAQANPLEAFFNGTPLATPERASTTTDAEPEPEPVVRESSSISFGDAQPPVESTFGPGLVCDCLQCINERTLPATTGSMFANLLR